MRNGITTPVHPYGSKYLLRRCFSPQSVPFKCIPSSGSLDLMGPWGGNKPQIRWSQGRLDSDGQMISNFSPFLSFWVHFSSREIKRSSRFRCQKTVAHLFPFSEKQQNSGQTTVDPFGDPKEMMVHFSQEKSWDFSSCKHHTI